MSQTKVKSGLLNFPDQTDFVKLPSGTTAQRPVSPEKGYSRYNTTDNKLEFWNGTEWQQLPGIVAPIITSISYPGDDLAADPAGGQTITINGSDFKAGATVTVGGTTPSVITFVSATQITFEAPAKAAGDYDIVVTNVDGGNATSVNGMAYNGVPSWTTPAGNLGTFPAGSTIPTITLVATEPDSGVISYSVTTGALPTGLTLTGADIDGNVPTPAGETTYNFSVTASDDENQSTERAFNIVVYLQVTNTVSAVDPFGDSSGLALYRLEDNANDEGGVYNGTWVGTPAYTTGVFGQSATFNGTNNYIAAPNNSLLGLTEYSVSAWVNPNALGTSYRTIVSNYGYQAGSSESGWIFMLYLNKVKIFNARTGVTQNFDSNSTIPTGVWSHILVTNTQSKINIYINGNFDSSHSTSGFQYQLSLTNYLSIGAYDYTGGTGGYFTGSIDQARIFNRVLTPLEVSSLYQERIVLCGGQAETVDILGDNSCIALYPLDGNANDLSGNYSGTPTDVSYGVGEFDLAGVFNGSSSIIKNGDLGVDFRGQTELSVSCWFKTNQSVTLQSLFGFSATGDASTELFVNIRSDEGNALGFINRNDGTGIVEVRASGSGSVIDNVWHNVVFVASSSGTKLYLDGSELTSMTYRTGSASTQISMPSDLNQFNIGGSQDSGGIEFLYNGSIDQVRIFNKALSSGEVTTLYNETACDVLACSGTTNTLDILGDSSCIAAYPLDGSPLDLSGNYNGVQTDVTYPVGKFDLGGSFNGSSSFINLGQQDQFANSQVSFSTWINPSVFTNSSTVILASTNGGSFAENDFALYFRDDNTSGFIGTEVGQSSSIYEAKYTTTTAIPLNTWTHIVLTFDTTLGTNITKVFINGVSQSLTSTYPPGGTFSGNILNSTLNLNIGKRNISGSELYFNGSIDQVRIFNKALSAGEVTTLYNETACN